MEIREGQGVTLRASAAGVPTAYTWDLDNDGVFGDESSAGVANGADLTLTAGELQSLGIDDGAGSYAIGVLVSYGTGSGGIGVDQVNTAADLSVLNAPPTAQLVNSTAAPSSPVPEGSSATVSFVNQGDPSTVDAAAGFTYSYDFDNDGVFEIVDSTDSTVDAPGSLLKDSGVRTVRAVIKDKDGGSTEFFTGVRVAEVAPTLIVAGDDAATEGVPYALELSATDPGEDTIQRWTVDWGDGTVETVNAQAASLTHTFADDGNRTVRVTAQDEDGIYTAQKVVAVSNQAPTLTVTGPDSVLEGDAFTLTLEADDPGSDTVGSWLIDWGDGSSVSLPGTATTADHVYADDSAGGVFTVSVTATDEDGAYQVTQEVSVENVAPIAALDGVGTQVSLLDEPASSEPNTVTVKEGSTFILQIAPPEDPGDDTVTEYQIDWGDGSSVQTVAAPQAGDSGLIPTLEVSHIYADGGALHTVSITLTDEDGSFLNANTLDVDVRNVAPLIKLTGASIVDEGETYSLILGPINDPGPDTVTNIEVDWGDGTLESFPTIGTVTHIYDGVSGTEAKLIRVNLTDEDGVHLSAASKSVQVVEVERVPLLDVSGDPEALEGTPYTLTLGELTESGPGGSVIPVSEYVVHWGDGSVETFTSAGPVQHTFEDGVFNNIIRVDVVTATDTWEDIARLPLTVLNAAPEITSLTVRDAPLPDLNGDNVINFADISIVTGSYGRDPSTDRLIAAADLNGDGVVDMSDVMAIFPLNGTAITPIPALTGVGSVAEGGTAFIEGTFTDLGVADSHEALIDWGDGTTTVASVSATVNGEGSFFGRHTYGVAGIYEVTVTLADYDDGADTIETVAYVTGAAVHDGVLHIVGTGIGDVVGIVDNAVTGTVDVTANFLIGTRSYDPAGLSGVVVYTGEGNDVVDVADGVTLPLLMLGGAGSDTLNGGGADDVIIGGPGADSVSGGSGNDLLFGGADNDALNGGGDDDTAIYARPSSEYDPANLAQVSSLNPAHAGTDSLAEVEHLIFDETDDSFFSSANPWADDVVARLKGPATEIDERDSNWLLFD